MLVHEAQAVHLLQRAVTRLSVHGSVSYHHELLPPRPLPRATQAATSSVLTCDANRKYNCATLAREAIIISLNHIYYTAVKRGETHAADTAFSTRHLHSGSPHLVLLLPSGRALPAIDAPLLGVKDPHSSCRNCVRTASEAGAMHSQYVSR